MNQGTGIGKGWKGDRVKGLEWQVGWGVTLQDALE